MQADRRVPIRVSETVHLQVHSTVNEELSSRMVAGD
jgi:hypothetical protein